MNVSPGFGKRVRALAEVAGSGNKLAEFTGVSSGTMSNWQNELGMLPSKVTAFAEEAGVDPEWLLRGLGSDEEQVERFRFRFESRTRGGDATESIREDPRPYGRDRIDVSHFTNALLAQIIDELAAKTDIPGDERLRLIAPYQAELSRRLRSRSGQGQTQHYSKTP
jgi:transcriptional regulator with XRE-family HTH domain